MNKCREPGQGKSVMGFLDKIMERTQTPTIAVSILPEVAKQAIYNGQLPKLNTNNIFLKSDECCCYIDKTIILIDKTKKIYQHRGGSAPGLFKGTRVTWGSGKPIEYTETEQQRGILYITNKRVILQSKKEGFEKLHRYLTAIKPYSNAVELQYGKKTYSLIVPDGNLVYHVLQMINNVERN